MKLVFLGTGAGAGTPSFFCNCKVCKEARENPKLSRTRSAILLWGKENTLIDAPPDVRIQLLREHISDVDRIFLTHWHYDHFAGLWDMALYVNLKRKRPIDLYLSDEAMRSFQNTFEDSSSFNLIEIKEFQPCHFDDFDLTPIEAIHGTHTLGFLIESKLRVAYLPDTYMATEKTKKLIRDIDILIVDATFFGESLFKDRRHMTVDEAIGFGQEINAKSIYLTHLSMHYTRQVTSKELVQYVKKYGNVKVAYDGLKIDI